MDNAAYMLEHGRSKLPELMKKVLEIDGKFFVRLGMMNPSDLMPVLDDMIEIYKDPKMFKFLHIPVQSGNDEILKLMNRKYTVDDFKNIVAKFRKEILNITISTDVIAGFPTETEEQFKDSLDLIKEIKPEVLNISMFRPRPRTNAFSMAQLPSRISKDRTRLLTDIFQNIARMNNEKWIDWKGNVLIDEVGKENSFIGRNIYYKPVVVKGNLKLGDIAEVKIKQVTSFDLRGI